MASTPPDSPPAAAKLPAFSEVGSANAPLVYFENALAYGHLNGVIRVTLEAMRLYPNVPGEAVTLERVAVAHLRMSVQAAQSLKNALDAALLLAAPPASARKN